MKRVRTTDTTDDAFELLARTFTAVCALREEAGLEFVVAPLRAADESVLRRLSDRYSVVVHPFIPARTAGPNGEFENDVDRSAVLRMVIAVHQARLGSSRTAVRDDGSIPHRDVLIDALDRGDRPWETGPYSERARLLLAAHAGDVRRLLDVYDRTVDDVLADDARMVMTHGEPHAANVMIGGDGRYHVVDWDTAASRATGARPLGPRSRRRVRHRPVLDDDRGPGPFGGVDAVPVVVRPRGDRGIRRAVS